MDSGVFTIYFYMKLFHCTSIYCISYILFSPLQIIRCYGISRYVFFGYVLRYILYLDI